MGVRMDFHFQRDRRRGGARRTEWRKNARAVFRPAADDGSVAGGFHRVALLGVSESKSNVARGV